MQYSRRPPKPNLHYDPNNITTNAVDRDAMRAALALAAVNNYYAEHVGIKSAFLHEKADPNIQLHMHQPPRFNGQRKHPGAVGKVSGNLYGSKQACKIFMDGLRKHLIQLGFY